jgi:hypothetical protein
MGEERSIMVVMIIPHNIGVATQSHGRSYGRCIEVHVACNLMQLLCQAPLALNDRDAELFAQAS